MLRTAHKAQMRSVQRAIGRYFAVRCWVCLNRLWVGRLEAEAAGNFNRAKNDLQDMQRAAGLEPVCVGAYPAHGVERDRATLHGLVFFAPEIGPFLFQFKSFVKGHTRDLCCKRTNAFGRDAAAFRNRLWRVFFGQVFFRHHVEHGAMGHAVCLMRG